MPLVRFGVRNEYSLGQPELYTEVDREDPKAVLDGVAVAGLVGILRQLGDLAEFAAEVFHGLQEQVTSTASRSHRLKVRVQNIEAALPPIEKAILAQNSHIHFAYTAGSEWHPRIQNEQNHFIYNDLPRFIMDSYEESRDPPRLHLLDKFDTGGPGSCLKRYSDPTFFRRASGSLRETGGEKVQRDKKARKIKKKRSLQRKGSSLRNGSISSQSTRFQFFPSAGNGRTSPSHTASSIDMTLKSDLGDRSNSFDSRTGSSHIECVFRPSSSMQPEEQEESVEFCSRSFQQDDDIHECSFTGEQPGVADDNFLHPSSPEQVPPRSSCVTWDEKEEISEAKSQHSEGDEAPADILGADSVAEDIQESRAVAEIHIPKGVPFEDENIRGPSSIFTQLYDVESEPDNFMDALNTIDTESETDVDYQTKHEVKQGESLSTSNGGRTEDVLNVLSAVDTSDHRHPQIDDHTPSDTSSCNEMAADVFVSVPSVSPAEERAPEVPEVSSSASDSESGTLASTSIDPPDGSKEVESAVFDRPSSGIAVPEIQELLPDEVLNSPDKPQESPVPELSRVESIKIWTNGGLLGLEPSKPPDFNMSNTDRHGSETSTTEATNSPMPINNGDTRKLNKDGECIEILAGPRSPASWHDDNVAKADKHSSDSHCRSRFHPYGGGLTSTGLPLSTNVKPTSEEASHEDDEHSSHIFGLGQRLLANGFRKKISLVPSCEPEMPNSSPQQSKQPFVKFQASPLDVRFGHKSADYHLTSSPPLEHMKISFQPTNDFEAFSKLKLKFPDGSNYCSESSSSRDVFPSFQLVPEAVATGRNDVASDSDDDDDTFCRSSPYMSDDDGLSRHSDMDSEDHWEAGGSPESVDDVIPSAEETAHAENDGAVSCLSATVLDLPSFDDVKPPHQEVRQEDFDPLSSLELLQHPKASSPLPPPLPPAQWRLSNPISEPQATFDAHQPKPAPVMTQQSKPAPASEQQQSQVVVPFKVKSKDEQKLNWVKEANQPANGKVMDEHDDFLHQIRSKSFSLRPTAPSKTLVSETTANNRVTEILKKANAIRQAVASDVDDDDAWSDNP
ncbi:unnamed protein product [Linum trigynum]|uniref:Protein SCAR n=1 Tax=Linum trigynum TaxID=586398 RepID=A0AAV2GJD6_9ROSI